jgi:glucose-1-phosphate cytidylyltransferase
MDKYVGVILCGGQSLRMRFEFPYTNKVLVPINGKPIIHHLLDNYTEQSVFKKLVICLGNDSEEIMSSIKGAVNFESDTWNNVPITFLETGTNVTATNRVIHSLNYFDDNSFFLSYADVISDIDIRTFLKYSDDSFSDMVIALVKARMPYGRVALDSQGVILHFEEKPILEDWINAGYFYMKRTVFQGKTLNMEFESEFLPYLITKKKVLKGYKHLGFWKGIDTYKDLISLSMKF